MEERTKISIELNKKILTRKIKTDFTHEGHYTLSNGSQSNVYFDIKGLALSNFGAGLITDGAYDIMRQNMISTDIVGGMETGGIVIADIIGLRFGDPRFYVRRTEKKYGLNKRIEGDISTPRNILLVDDVVTTGRGIVEAYNLLPNPSRVKAILCVVSRPQFGGESYIRENCGHELPFYSMTTEDQIIAADRLRDHEV